MDIRDKFKARIQYSIRESYEIGYSPIRFESMIQERHPVEVAKTLVLSGEIQTGVRELKRLNRLDLTIESLMCLPEFKVLFTSDELTAAKWRLKEA
ncbi:hypothetical protein GSF04_18420 [Pseudoalteromonas sp. A22]|uniref:hypothetical protein n=1 Tax=Pseudoalteromonas TaxID=53246 RepID=UPI001BA5CAAA|nr:MULTISPECIES: hypothetical protein [Pseudoalteromonas]QUI64348.1 hypothetical protein GSF04_18420 [Pseudoalteromonas sp. A22]USE70053.1 hypothetical protein CTT31_13365 [Pseudoalteromonas flavipulchra]